MRRKLSRKIALRKLSKALDDLSESEEHDCFLGQISALFGSGDFDKAVRTRAHELADEHNCIFLPPVIGREPATFLNRQSRKDHMPTRQTQWKKFSSRCATFWR